MKRNLRIAMIAPPWYPVPPRGYGGIELIVHLLKENLRALGHEVVVFGAEGSDADVVPIAPAEWQQDLGNHRTQWDRMFTYHWRVLKKLKAECPFDLIHDHAWPPGLFLWAEAGLTQNLFATLHEQMREPRLTTLRELNDVVQFVGISHSHVASFRELQVAGVVHNAVDLDSLQFRPDHDGYLLMISRINPIKGQHIAIHVAKALNRKLILAGKVDPSPECQAYFAEQIESELGDQVQYFENVSGEHKAALIAGAMAGIFPLQWEEPFGLAMAECMVSGTPVLALARGAAPELVENGVTGYVVYTVDELILCAEKLNEISRIDCANAARARFSPLRMAQDYEKLYLARSILGS